MSRKHNQEKKHQEKKTNWIKTSIIVGSCIIVALLVFAVISNNSSAGKNNPSPNPYLPYSGNAQVVNVGMSGGRYMMSPSQFEVGKPVRLEFNMNQIQGCARSVIIPEFGVRKLLSQSDNIIEFTPTKAGTFTMACSMNMYRGSFQVIE